jgi:hypothetical protein
VPGPLHALKAKVPATASVTKRPAAGSLGFWVAECVFSIIAPVKGMRIRMALPDPYELDGQAKAAGSSNERPEALPISIMADSFL